MRMLAFDTEYNWGYLFDGTCHVEVVICVARFNIRCVGSVFGECLQKHYKLVWEQKMCLYWDQIGLGTFLQGAVA